MSRSVWVHLVWPLCIFILLIFFWLFEFRSKSTVTPREVTLWMEEWFLYPNICFLYRLGKFSAIISSNAFLLPISLLWDPYYVQIAILYIISCLLSFFLIYLSVCCSDWVISVVLPFRALIHSSALSRLLFVVFNSDFISANEFSNFSWLPFIVACFSLQ